MKKLLCLLTTVAAGVLPALADHGAVVTEAVNKVTHGSAQSADASPAKVGTVLHDSEYLKTGAASRAEMKLPNATVTRLGANTIFNYSAASNQIDLQAGTVLFSKPKDGEQLNIKTQAVTAAILGTTGFIQVSGTGASQKIVFGLIEGTASGVADGTTFVIHGGELVELIPGQAPIHVAFDLPRMVRTSSLINKFPKNLPNEKYIQQALDKYKDLLARGFIEPGDGTFIFDLIDTPPIPLLGYDSAANQLNEVAHPEQPQPPLCNYGN